jgi:hypothetical protein
MIMLSYLLDEIMNENFPQPFYVNGSLLVIQPLDYKGIILRREVQKY